MGEVRILAEAAVRRRHTGVVWAPGIRGSLNVVIPCAEAAWLSAAPTTNVATAAWIILLLNIDVASQAEMLTNRALESALPEPCRTENCWNC